MAESSRTIMTDAGFALETRVRADETKMQFTRAAISTDDHFSDTDDALAKLTELSNIQQDGKVTAVQVINTTTVYVQVDVNQAESKADYQMRSAALYAKDDDGTEVLYGVTVLQDPVFVHKDADGSYLGFGINTTVGKASNVVVVVDPANMVTQQVFEGTMKNYYTKAEVDAKTADLPDMSLYVLKADLPDFTTFATTKWVTAQIAAIPKPDMSQYYTKTEVDGFIKPLATSTSVASGDSSTLASAKAYTDDKVAPLANNDDIAPFVEGMTHNGADLNTEMSPGSFRSDTNVKNSPFAQDIYIGWTNRVVMNSDGEVKVIHQTAYTQLGTVASRTYWGGSGWGPWKGMVQDNGNGTITVNGQTYTPANDTYAIKRNDAGNTVGTVKIPDGNLQSSVGDRFYPIKWFNSYDEAMTYSKAHPYVDCRW